MGFCKGCKGKRGPPEPSCSNPKKLSSSRQKRVFLRFDPIGQKGGLSLNTLNTNRPTINPGLREALASAETSARSLVSRRSASQTRSLSRIRFSKGKAKRSQRDIPKILHERFVQHWLAHESGRSRLRAERAVRCGSSSGSATPPCTERAPASPDGPRGPARRCEVAKLKLKVEAERSYTLRDFTQG
jgi:hypothetical protein